MTATLDLTEIDIQNMYACELAELIDVIEINQMTWLATSYAPTIDRQQIRRVKALARRYLNAVNLKSTAQSISDTADDLEDTWGKV